MGRGWPRALWALFFLGGTASAGMAQECPPLRQIMSIPIKMQDSRILMPVRINGIEKMFMLDTAGAVSQIAPSVVAELKLPTDESGVKILDLYGRVSTTAAKMALALGQLQDRNASLQVATHEFTGEPYVGIIAADYMGRYDVEIDVVGGKLNYFSPDHCDGRVLYWQAPAIAIVPFRLRNSHIMVSATLNDREVRAILDTGAPTSALRADEAKRLFDVTVDTPGNTEIHELQPGQKQFLRVFQSLGLEGNAVGNPRIVVMPNLVGSRDPNNGYETGTRLRKTDDIDSSDPPLIIGLNVISRLRIYIAFKEGKLYVTPPVRPAPTAPPAN